MENIENNGNENNGQTAGDKAGNNAQSVMPVAEMYESWFLEYASYVILERAVPNINDGFKPVQRRIMHAMKEMDDGRFNKVANIIGSTMQYHPHGDASIGDAIVNLGQKDVLIETQGNWGDVRTGDGAAAPRYIEARLSKFAGEVIFNPQTTQWQLSYDGRKREPVTLPVKFPLLLLQGVEGIAVGLSTKILPHNFCELIEASIAHLQGKDFELYPDFPLGGHVDVSAYNGGLRGGKVKTRADIEIVDSKTLAIRSVPYGTTTGSLIESILKANDAGKIKIRKVEDNTAKDLEVIVSLNPGQSPDVAISALFAFTDCEISLSPNNCVIVNDKPEFLPVKTMLKHSADQTVDLLKQEQEILKGELLEKLLFSSLEKIFIENRIYRKIEECETWEAVMSTIDKGLEPFKKDFYRVITQDDIVKLTEIRIKRISKFDAFKADELMKKLQEELAEVQDNLDNLVKFAIKYFKGLLKKYGEGRGRKSAIKNFETIEATQVVANNQKLYVNREEGFIGYGLKKDEFISDCSDIDNVIAFRKDGTWKVVSVAEKVFVGKDIIHAAVFVKNDERKTYNAIYSDGKTGITKAKRFNITGITRDKDYDITQGTKGTKLLYFSANPNGEAEIVTVHLTAGSAAKKKSFEFDFSELEVKGRDAQGNIVSKYPVRKVQLKSEGTSTLGGLEIWYDETVGLLNRRKVGKHLGEFGGEDKILAVFKDGSYELTDYEITNRYDYENIALIEKFDPQKALSTVYYDGKQKSHFVKRFFIETSTTNKRFAFITEEKGSKLVVVTSEKQPQLCVEYKNPQGKTLTNVIDFDMLIEVRGWKALGSKLAFENIQKLSLAEGEDDAVESGGAGQMGLF